MDALKETVKPEILPQEYGGSIPIAGIIKDFKCKLLQKRSSILSLDEMCIELTKDCNNSSINIISEIDDGVIGSFRKLEVD